MVVLMSLTSRVPAALPSLFHSCRPWTPSSAEKKSVPSTTPSAAGYELKGPGKMSLTIIVPAAVPSLVHGAELWTSDGTAAGTMMVKDILPGPLSSYPAALGVVDGTLFFSADDGVHGRQLWKSDGSAAGTLLVKDINTTIDSRPSSNPTELTDVNGTLFFVATGRLSSHPDLWKSDGTAAGTMMVKDFGTGFTFD